MRLIIIMLLCSNAYLVILYLLIYIGICQQAGNPLHRDFSGRVNQRGGGLPNNHEEPLEGSVRKQLVLLFALIH